MLTGTRSTPVSYQEFLMMFRKQTNSIVSQLRIQSGVSSSDKATLVGIDAIIPGGGTDSHELP